ncbi:outer membrane protein assembly factor BamB family protein [Lignipirellula cremea]|uniref:Outer membrane biogenesis protein BamB n=1 Tax=Lignipirellula cremea TaxID=2528010 RepID=A0A518E141_9BACT|nr:PQQ-binding-like beta-propeller repeat protein [Lignipirellula cremea]QDU97781.1 outer membrane biogenesis protein BamB [Lignipirellula cremea]
MRTPLLSLALLLLGGTPAFCQLQVGTSGLVDTSALARFGLVRQWHSSIEVDRSRGELAFITPFISQVRGTTVLEVSDGRRVVKFAEKDRDRFGERIGLEEAQKRAKEQVYRFERLGVKEPTTTTLVVPEVTLYCATDHGTIHALDGETGETIWVRTVGSRNHPTLQPGVNEHYVAIVNGSILYILDRLTGRDLWSRQLQGVPGAGPAVADFLVHVPMLDGMMESYQLVESRQPRAFYKSHGRAMLQPIVTRGMNKDPDGEPFVATSLVWATDRGHVYVNHANKKGDSRFRLEANDTITAPPVFMPPNKILVTSVDGYVYCVHEKTGDMVWRFSAGEPITRSASPIGDAVYVTCDIGGLYKIDAETGEEVWWVPRIRKFLGATSGRVYAQNENNRIVILDSATGGRLGELSTETLNFAIPNISTNRIYVGNRKGTIQCLREIPDEYPTVYNAIEAEEVPETQQADAGEGTGGAPAAGPVNPFGGGAPSNPFGGGAPADPFGGAAPADPFGAGGAAPADPFGAGGAAPADPFGAGGAAPAADPFGAGGAAPAADPFGAGGAAPAADPFGAAANPFGN